LSSNKTAVTSGSLIEAAIEKYIYIVKTYEIQIVASAGPAWIIPIIADMMCKICKEIRNQKIRQKCVEKFCLQSVQRSPVEDINVPQ
jgi:hypothetical protein